MNNSCAEVEVFPCFSSKACCLKKPGHSTHDMTTSNGHSLHFIHIAMIVNTMNLMNEPAHPPIRRATRACLCVPKLSKVAICVRTLIVCLFPFKLKDGTVLCSQFEFSRIIWKSNQIQPGYVLRPFISVPRFFFRFVWSSCSE